MNPRVNIFRRIFCWFNGETTGS